MMLTRTLTRPVAIAVGTCLLAALASGCSSSSSKGGTSSSDGTRSGGGGSGGSGTTITLWTHNAGNDAELAADKVMVTDFNASQSKYTVKVQAFPQAAYNSAVTAAASAKKLPCVLDVDSPNVPSWAWGNYIQPIDLSGSKVGINDQLPSTVGKYDNQVYSFGLYDVSLTFIARKSVLTRNGIRIPTMASPWTLNEFNSALAKLKSSGKFQYPLDLQTASSGSEWAPYAWSPLLQSFGGDLINRDGYKTAKGALDGPAAQAWATWFGGLVKKGYMAAKSGTSSNDDFLNGKTALLYDGSWDALTDLKKLGKDVAFLPPPNLGHGPKVGGGSWQWAMGAGCKNKDGANQFLQFMRQSKYFASVAKATGTIPAAYAVANADPNYKVGGPLHFAEQFAKTYAVVRPVSPGYPFIATTFEKTSADLLAGANPKSELGQAAGQIDSNIQQNNNFK